MERDVWRLGTTPASCRLGHGKEDMCASSHLFNMLGGAATGWNSAPQVNARRTWCYPDTSLPTPPSCGLHLRHASTLQHLYFFFRIFWDPKMVARCPPTIALLRVLGISHANRSFFFAPPPLS